MCSYIGDFAAGSVVRRGFNTATVAGVPITLAGGVVAVYKDGSDVPSTAGATLTVDFDGLTGHHLIAVDTAADGSFYAAGSDFRVVLTAGTVDGTSVIGAEVLSFSLAGRSALRPAVAGREVDVDAAGKVALDQAFPANFAALAIAVGGEVTAGTVSDKSGYALAAAGLDAVPIEVGVNARQALSPILAAAAGSITGVGTGTITVSGGGVSTTRIVATSSSGNRTQVTLSLPDLA